MTTHTLNDLALGRQFVVDCVSAIARGADAPATSLNVEAWLECAEIAGVTSLIAYRIKKPGRMINEQLERSKQRGVAHHLRKIADLRVVQRTLDAAGVRWLLFKGPALAELVYEIPSSRAYGDLDILIHPSDLERGLEALLKGPATLIDQNWRLISDRKQGEISLMVGHSVIDLHWHFHASEIIRNQFGLDITKPIDRRVTVRIGGMDIPTLDAVDTAVFVALHAALSGGHRLKWLLDIHLSMVHLGDDLTLLKARSSEYRTDLAMQSMLTRSGQFLDPRLVAKAKLFETERVWSTISALTNRFAEPEADLLGRYSGRAVFSATRATGPESVRALINNINSARREGQARRTAEIDRSMLHNPGGTIRDRQTWTEYVASYGDIARLEVADG